MLLAFLANNFTPATCAVSGTAVGPLEEDDIVAGGRTIVLTLSEATWVTSGATFNAVRQAIIDGLDSAESEATGWNAEVRDKEVVSAVVRTSDTVVTITLTAAPNYDINAQEVVTVTIPASATNVGVSFVATPTVRVSFAGDSSVPLGTFGNYAPTRTDTDLGVSNYEICQRSGFKMPAGTLVKEWTGLMVRPQDRDPRHPQELVRPRPEKPRPSPSPEQEDSFLSTNEVTASIL